MKSSATNKRASAPTPNGSLLIIGGAEKNGSLKDQDNSQQNKSAPRSTILELFFKHTASRKPVIELITSASSEKPEKSYEEYKSIFESCGTCQVNHIHHDSRDEVNLNEIKERLQAAHGVFFAGGDQLKITSIYGGTDFLCLLKERYVHEKLVIAGTSAGAMAISTPMIYAGVGRDEMIAGNVKVTTGLEFLRDVCVDTHFVDRGRFVRMAQVIATNPTCIGIGIESDTAILVQKGVEAEVVGSGVVIIIDAKNSFEPMW
jgi:cyanophycinase